MLQEIRDKNLGRLIQNGQRVGVITYTNAACDEIQHRLSMILYFMYQLFIALYGS
ncbi:hypothetical protein L2D52_15765 [Vibrio chagasii]